MFLEIGGYMNRKKLHTLLLAVAGFLMIISFQNCSNKDYRVDTRGQEKVLEPTPTSTPPASPESPCVNCETNALPLTNETKYREKVTSLEVPNKVDILVIVDNSKSMKEEMLKIQERFNHLISKLSEVDWRIALITTDLVNHDPAQDLYGQGQFITKSNDPEYCLNKIYIQKPIHKEDEIKAEECFKNRVYITPKGDASEQGIHALNMHLEKGYGQEWMRDEAHFAVIILSDEDEYSASEKHYLNPRSTDSSERLVHESQTSLMTKADGTQVRVTYTDRLSDYDSNFYFPKKNKSYKHQIILKPYVNEKLTIKNSPSSIGPTLKAAFPELHKSVSFHSIVVSDLKCLAKEGLHMGEVYMQASRLMNGFIANICDQDYSAPLVQISDKIKKNISSLQLECTPVVNDDYGVALYVNGMINKDLQFKVEANQAFFLEEVEPGAKIELRYFCAEQN